MKINYALISRSLIALVFVIAGIQKLFHFSETSATISSVGVPLAPLATLIVILIEIPVAIAFAKGYKTCLSGWILIGFTALVTFIMHGNIGVGMNLIMALKNLAIIGGILAVISSCMCIKCKGKGCETCKNGTCETHGK